MRGRVIAWVGVLAAFGAAGACALDIPDVIVDGGVDASTKDSAQDINVPDVPIPQCDASCAPTGFTPVLFALDQSTACPGTMQTLDLAADPGAAPATACPCDCAITSPPQCLPATITHEIQTVSDGGAPSCTVGGNSLTFDGGCLVLGGFNIHFAWQGDPYPTFDAGTCTSNSSSNPTKVPQTASRLCIDKTCAGTCAPQGNFKACVYASGAVACPTGFTQTHHAGTVNVACGACSACSVTGGQCEGTIGLYSDFACGTKIIDVSMDGGCASTGSANGQVSNSLEYTPVVVGAICTPGKTGTGTVSLAGEITVCCP